MVSLLWLVLAFLLVFLWFELAALFPKMPCGPFWARGILAAGFLCAGFWINADFLADCTLDTPVDICAAVAISWLSACLAAVGAGILLVLDRFDEVLCRTGDLSFRGCMRSLKIFFLGEHESKRNPLRSAEQHAQSRTGQNQQ